MKIAVIPDGARRWARRDNVPLEKSYETTFARLLELIERLSSHSIAELHIYLLSKFNLERADSDLVPCIRQEVNFVKLLDAGGYLAGIVGDVSAVFSRSAEARPLVDYTVNSISVGTVCKPRVWVYFGYSAEWHVADILRRLGADSLNPIMKVAQKITGENALDLAIRTGGEKTLSDFLPLQLRYAQLEFLEGLFNDIPVEHFVELILRAKLARQARRFGR